LGGKEAGVAYILDAYNVVYAGDAMGGAMSGLTVRKLCQWIVGSPQRLAATLVLDGRAKPDEPSENEFPEVTLVYSGTGIKADTVIAQMVERSGNRKKLTVVTNDRAVALHARRNFAGAMSCEAFLTHLIGGTARAETRSRGALPAKKTGGSATAGETDHWLKEFGITPPPPAPPPPTPTAEDPFGEIDMDKLMGD
jgi:predicted RNA-binding protein with PIN domain